MYLPISFPSLVAGISFSSVGCPFTINLAGCSSVIVIGAIGSPSVNLGVPVWTWPCLSIVVTSSPLGTTGVTSGVYLPVAGVPFLSLTWTVTPSTVPTNSGLGVNVTTPVNGSILYLPISFPSLVAGISFSSVGCPFTINLAGCSSVIVIGAIGSPSVNVGVPVWTLPCLSIVLTSSPVGVTGVTSGVYVAEDVTVKVLPSMSKAVAETLTRTPDVLPMNCGSGVNVTTPVDPSIAYLPWPLTTTAPALSAPSNVYTAVDMLTFVPSGVFSIVFSLPNLSNPVIECCTLPCLSIVVSSVSSNP